MEGPVSAAIAADHAREVAATACDVVDGDTIRVRATRGSRRRYTVRLIGIDTPETKRPGTPRRPHRTPTSSRGFDGRACASGELHPLPPFNPHSGEVLAGNHVLRAARELTDSQNPGRASSSRVARALGTDQLGGEGLGR